MATLEEIVVQLTAETGQLRAELASAAKAVKENTEKMDKAIQGFSEKGTKNLTFFQSAMATMTGVISAEALHKGFEVVIELGEQLAEKFIEGGKEAQKEQESLQVLANSLAATGHYSKEALEGLSSYAEEMKGLALVSKDVVLQNIQVLSSLTQLNDKGLKEATDLAINFAAAYNKDLGSATQTVAKAINGNSMALQKMGIHMELTGSRAENLRLLQEKLSATNGAAAAKANTFGGALFVLRDAYNDVFKELSKNVQANKVIITIMNEVTKIFDSFIHQLEGGDTSIRDGISKAILDLLGIIQATLSGFSTFFQVANMGWQVMATGITTVIHGAFALSDLLDGNTEAAKAQFDQITASAEKTAKTYEDLGQDSFLDAAAKKLGDLKDAAQKTFDETKGKANEAADGIKNVGGAANDSTGKLTEAQTALKEWAAGLLKATYDSQTVYDTASAQLKESLDGQLVSQTDYFDQLATLEDDRYAADVERLQSAIDQGLVLKGAEFAELQALEQTHAKNSAKIRGEADKNEIANRKDTMSIIAGLANSSNQTLSAIGKAAAITQIAIDTPKAVGNAIASGIPFPGNMIAAGLVGAAMAAQAANIAGVQLAGGIDSVPFSSRGGNSGDNFNAVLQPGERVVPTSTNNDLKDFLSNQGGGSNMSLTVNVMPGTGMNNEQIGNLIEALNNFMYSSGMKLGVS